MNVLTIMEYKPQQREAIDMCRAWLNLAIKAGADNLLILYGDNRPDFVKEFASLANIQVERRKRLKSVGPHGHILLTLKLPALSQTPAPFLFIDADAYALVPLEPIWRLKGQKPWISTPIQRIPWLPDTLGPQFVSAGVQLVSDSGFYDFGKIMKAFEADDFKLRYPGMDQSVLTTFAHAMEYDYTHPDVGDEWNAYAGASYVKLVDGKWVSGARDLPRQHPVYIRHYWCEKPWMIDCPMHNSIVAELNARAAEG